METILTVAGVIIVGLIGTIGIVVGKLYDRVARLERNYRNLWTYTRGLLDLYYRHRKAGAPNPPPLPAEE